MHAPLSLLVSLDMCRLLAPPRAGAGTLLSLSSLLRGRPAEIRRPPYLPSCSSLLSLSLSLPSPTFPFSISSPLPFDRPLGLSEPGARGMPSAAGAITYDVDCQNLGEAPGVPLTRRSPIEYSTYDLATLSRRLRRAAPRRAAPASRRERGNARTRAASSRAPGDLTRSSTFVLTSGRLPGRLSVRGARAAFLLLFDTRHWSMTYLSRRATCTCLFSLPLYLPLSLSLSLSLSLMLMDGR
jgi:hypothetical protein